MTLLSKIWGRIFDVPAHGDKYQEHYCSKHMCSLHGDQHWSLSVWPCSSLGTWQLEPAKQSHRTFKTQLEWVTAAKRCQQHWTSSHRVACFLWEQHGCKHTGKYVKWTWKKELNQREEMDLDGPQGHPHFWVFVFFCFCLWVFFFKQKYILTKSWLKRQKSN